MMKESKSFYINGNSLLGRNKFLFHQGYSFDDRLFFAYILALFFFPLLPLTQLITGSIVNALLIKSAMTIKTKRVYLLTIIPSIAAFSAGILFGNLTHQLVIMLPFIWLANFVLMYLIRRVFVSGGNEFFYSNLVAGGAKTLTLFVPAILLFSFSVVPVVALTVFGIMQFVTVQLGGVIVIIGDYAKEKLVKA